MKYQDRWEQQFDEQVHEEFEPWIGVDLDGTLAEYHGYAGAKEIGKPIPKMVERVKKWINEGKRVKIFTARVADDLKDGRDTRDVATAIKDWCQEHIGKRLEVTNVKDHRMAELWDDRAVQVIPNTGERVGHE